MIPRYQRIVYWCLLGGTLLLAAFILRGCVRSHERIAAMRDESPIAAPTNLPNETVSVALANDADGSVTLDSISLPLPEEPALRAQTLLTRVLADDAQSPSTHPLPNIPAIADVFLLGLPVSIPGPNGSIAASAAFSGGNAPQGSRNPEQTHSSYGEYHAAGAQLAVVNLTKAFADAHPSGVETEDLTLRQIIATLHSVLPQVEEVRFLVDGQSRDTLNGHADLSRPYSVKDPAKDIHVLSPDGNPL